VTTIERLREEGHLGDSYQCPTCTYPRPCTIGLLLDVAEAARALAAVHEALHRRGDPEWEGWECDERNALCAALARLDGAEVGA